MSRSPAFPIATIAVALFAAPALAGEMIMTRAIEAASLHEGSLDMVAYYVPASGGPVEVTATFAPLDAAAAADPTRIVMALVDGDDVAFSMPGYPDSLYRFVRAGDAVTVSVREVRPPVNVAAGL